MTSTGLDVFDTTLHKTNAWLNELRTELLTEDRHLAYLALRATLHALRDRLPTAEVAHLGAQLPMLIRGLYYEGWNPKSRPLKLRRKEEFLARIAEELQRVDDAVDPELLAEAVFAVLARRITEGEIEDVKGILPSAIRELWPERDVSAA
jgi:uncharacterized protein (DUF2267 family)